MLINRGNYPDNETQRCREYIEALEEERRKIQVFRRELPLCLELVTQTIEAYKQQISGATTETPVAAAEYNLNGQSECSEQTSNGGPVLEEFIPMKRAEESEEEDYEEQSHNDDADGDDINNNGEFNLNDGNNSKKSDWLRSVQLWNQFPDPATKEESARKMTVTEVNRNGIGGAFHPFKKEKSVVAATAQPAAAAASSTADTGGRSGDGSGGGSKKEEKEGLSQRKQRRCWSPELHKRFLQALQQLGGSHAATPKQIRELMKVDGLTNDEVKSHLQKYRLHTRRPSPSIHNNNNINQQAPQFVVVGGIWMPPPEYTAMAAAPTTAAKENSTSNGIYAPIASVPTAFQEPPPSASNKRPRGSQKRSGSRSNGESPATSSSTTHTTTASPAY